VVEFLPPIPAGLKRAAFMEALQNSIDNGTSRLLAEGRQILEVEGLS